MRERIAEHPVLVTFNGKSFDWPLLETRYRMSRKISVPSPRAHLDFLHPARNLWRLRLGSVRLSELERHVLGWDRGAHVLSGLIPQIYFDYVRGGSPEGLYVRRILHPSCTFLEITFNSACSQLISFQQQRHFVPRLYTCTGVSDV